MNYSAKAVANAFLDLAQAKGQTLTNMQVQKLVFLAQGYALALLDRPLLTDDIHAWTYGPVIQPLYEALRKYGSGNVTEKIPYAGYPVDDSSTEMKLIAAIEKAYGQWDGLKLSKLTHVAGSPWSQAWNEEKFSIIDSEIIKKYYKDTLAKANSMAE